MTVTGTTVQPVALTPNRGPTEEPGGTEAAGTGTGHRLRALLIAGGTYLVLSVVVWWHVWTGHPTSTTTCGCGDTSLFTWFLEWPAYAIAHGLNPLYSAALFHPTGIDLLSNTSELGIGVVLAPVTWLFGPVATLNVALTLGPALSALAMFVLLRRWVWWAPAAFVGGLLYGFSPLILVSLTDAHLMIGVLVVPPLVVACLDELLVRQRRRPAPVGVVLGLLVVVQFFLGTEVLVIMAVTAVIGVGLLLLYAAVRHPAELARRARHAAVGLATGGAVAVVLLAYPAWFALAGPAHLSGPVWGSLYLGFGGVTLRQFVLPTAASPSFTTLTHQVGGYQGPTLSGQYLGIGLLVVLAAGTIIWRRDRRLWLFGVVGLVSVVLSLGLENHVWVPWRWLVRIPLVQNIIPGRFVSMTYLAAAVMFGIVIDHSRTAAMGWRTSMTGPAGGNATGGPPAPPGRRRRLVGAAAGVAVALVGLVPVATYLAGSTPMTVQPVVLPTWYAKVGSSLPPGQVVLAYPVPFTTVQSVMTWQAVDRMRWSMVGGGGPESLWYRDGKEEKGQMIIAVSSLLQLPPEDTTPSAVAEVRQSIDGWGVTMVVIPDQAGLPEYDKVRDVPAAVGLITAATGQRPVHQADAWVWTNVREAGPPARVSSTEFETCVTGAGGQPRDPAAVSDCVLGRPAPS